MSKCAKCGAECWGALCEGCTTDVPHIAYLRRSVARFKRLTELSRVLRPDIARYCAERGERAAAELAALTGEEAAP